MPRTPLLNSLVKLAHEHQRAELLGIPVAAFRERIALAKEAHQRDPERPLIAPFTPAEAARRRGLSRRGFLGGVAAATAAATMIPRVGRAAPKSRPRIAIIGGGIAGLSAALHFQDRGVDTYTVYESSNRVGGRMFSNNTYFDGGQVFEWAGELIDSGHLTIRSLAQRFGLELDDLLGAEPAGSKETYFFDGQFYSKATADEDFTRDIMPVLKSDLQGAGYPTTVYRNTAWGRMLNEMSVYDYIESRVPGGHDSPMGQLLDTAYYIELNSDTREQASLNLLYLLAFQPERNVLNMFGESDEKYHIRGGNGQLPQAIANHIGSARLKMDMRLMRIKKTPAGAYELTFKKSNGSTTVTTADSVLVCTPFATLGDVDYSQAGFDDQKHYAIQNLGRGRQSKQHVQFNERIWNTKGPRPDVGNGSSYSDTGYQASWEATRAQPGTKGILVGYAGGAFADAMSSKVAFATATSRDVRTDAERFMAQAEPVFPGLTALWNGKATQGLPHLDPHMKCSYSYFKIGQYTTIAGYERVPMGKVYFAGEHCSFDFQGFMEGGALEGTNAAKQMIVDIDGLP